MANNNFSKNFFMAVLFGLMLLSLIIAWPLLRVIVGSAILAYLGYPIYRYIAQKINRKRIAAILVVFLLILIIIVPTYFVLNSLTKEGYSLFITVKQKLSSDTLMVRDCEAQPERFCEFGNRIVIFLKDPQVKFYLEDAISKFSSYLINQTSSLIVNLPNVAVNLVVMFFLIYYMLLDGTQLILKAKKSIPLKAHHVDHIIHEFENFTSATLYGNLITSIVQGILGGVIFFMLGLHTPILAGLAMAFFAFLPIVGTPLIWVPASISLFIAGETGKGVILLLLGIFLISTIDNIIKPGLIGKRTNLHPAGVLVGIIGGIYSMGLIGIIVGPLILSLLVSFIDVYYKEGYGYHNGN